MVVAADLDRAPAPWMEVHPLLVEPFIADVPKGTGTMNAAVRDLPFVHYTARHLMGRQIADHLTREGLPLDHRFELDSYHAIMAMVAEGAGWTILTPLGFLRAGRFRDKADVLPLPVAPLSRRIQLTARAGVFQDMPGRVADTLRGLLAEMIVTPAIERIPWLEADLSVLN